MSGRMAILWTAYEIALIGGPALAGAAISFWRGEREPVRLASWALAASGATALLSFWAFFGGHRLGIGWSYVLFVGSWIVALTLGIRARREVPWRRLAPPLLLWIAATFFVVSLGFLWGGTQQPLTTASVRFSHELPGDNYLPAYFGDIIYATGHHEVPPDFASWRSSDRPPLQYGYYVETKALGSDGDFLAYQVMAVALQQFWIVGAWILFRSARLRRSTTAIVIMAVLLGDIAIVHGFFVWPKLIAVGFVLALAGFVLTPRWRTERFTVVDGVLVGLLTALAVASHGTSVYAVAVLAIIALVRARPGRWFVLGFVVAAATLYAPWMAYQKWFDPSQDRLNKMMLAGGEVDVSKSTTRAILDAYGDVGLSGAVDLKVGNLRMLSGGADGLRGDRLAIEQAVDGDFSASIRTLRAVRFFSVLQQVGLLLAGPLIALVLALRRRRPPLPDELRLSGLLGAFSVGALATWALVQFGDSFSLAVLHAGSLAVPVGLAMACVLVLAAYSRRWALALTVVNALLVLYLYVPYVRTTVLPERTLSIPMAVLVLLSLAGAIATLVLVDTDASGHGSDEATDEDGEDGDRGTTSTPTVGTVMP